MYRVFAIAPYEGLKSVIQSVAQEYPTLDVHVEVANLEDGYPLVRRAIDEGYDVLLSRGGTAELVRKMGTIPVVEIHLSGYDVLRSILLSKGYSGQKAIVGFEQVIQSYNAILQLLDLNMDVYTIASEEELRNRLCDLQQSGINLVIGDVITTQVAQRIGLNSMLITSGKESVQEAFGRVLQMADSSRRSLRDFRILEDLLVHTQFYFLAFDEKGGVRFAHLPEGVDRAQLIATFAGRSAALLQSGSDAIVYRDPSGRAFWGTGWKNFADSDEAFCLWHIDEAKDEIDKVPKGIQLLTADRVPIVSRQLFFSGNEVCQKALRQLETLGRAKLSALIEGERGLNKTKLAYLYYWVDATAPLIVLDAAVIEPDVVDYLRQIAGFADAENRPVLLWRHLDRLQPKTQAALLNERLLLDGFRHVATAERILSDLINSGAFDRELYGQFRFIRVSIPPLRERMEDLVNLAGSMIGELNTKLGRQTVGLTAKAVERMKKHSWYGNEAQLYEVLERAMMDNEEPYIDESMMEPLLSSQRATINNYNILPDMTLEQIEKEIIHYVLREEDMNQAKAARRLGISRTTLWRRINS